MPIDDYLEKLEIPKSSVRISGALSEIDKSILDELTEYFKIYYLDTKVVDNERCDLRLNVSGNVFDLRTLYFAITSSFYLPERGVLLFKNYCDHQKSKYFPFPFRSKHSLKYYDIEILSTGDILDEATFESFRFNITNCETKILLGLQVR